MWAHGRTSKDAGSLGGTSLLLAVKRQKLPCAREHLLINQNYTEFFFFFGGEPDRSLQSPLQGKLKVIFFTCVLTRAVHICAHIPRPDAQPYAPLCFCRSPKPNTNKGSCILKSVGSLTFTWLLCKHLRELHKFQPRGSAPHRAEPYNSLQLKAESKAIGLAQHCAPMDLLFQTVSKLCSSSASPGESPPAFAPRRTGMLLPHPQGSLCPRALPANLHPHR